MSKKYTNATCDKRWINIPENLQTELENLRSEVSYFTLKYMLFTLMNMSQQFILNL